MCEFEEIWLRVFKEKDDGDNSCNFCSDIYKLGVVEGVLDGMGFVE